MKKISVDYILDAIPESKLLSDAGSAEVTSVAIDSRQVKECSLFFAVIGEKNDGHDFLPSVRENGCHAVIVSDTEWGDKIAAYGDMTVILVSCTRDALMQLAKRYIADWHGLLKVAVTGSVGKTGTKDFLGAVLSSKYKTGKTPGNLNSDYGLPLTVFGFDEDIEAAVLEMGAGRSVHISELADIARPDIGVVTNVGTSHLEAFGTRDILTAEKLGISKFFDVGNSIIVNSDCDKLSRKNVEKIVPAGTDVVTVGSEVNDNIIVYNIGDFGIDGVSCSLDVKLGLTEYDGTYKLVIPVIGAHNLGNAALAIAAGVKLGINPADGIRALADTRFSSGRLEVIKTDRFTIIDDSYNASPESMKSGLKILNSSKASRRVAILGDMYELGDESEALHESVGTYAHDSGIDLLITIGSNATAIARAAVAAKEAEGIAYDGGPEVIAYTDKDEAISEINDLLTEGDVILVKASRGMKLEDVISAIK